MLKVTNLSFRYHNSSQEVLKAISFSLEAGNHLSIMGPSGCGKSTLLELIYGLQDATEGEIMWQNKAVLGPYYHLVPGMDCMKYVSQNFDLMPYISVKENIGKHLSNIDKIYKNKRVNELLELVEMTEFADTKAQFLSGGQLQRVAIARALAQMPEVILLDEPFSHIDTFQKTKLRRNLFQYFKDHHITCLVATHDKADVLGFSDQILILNQGNILQQGNTLEVYQNPKNLMVASLFEECTQLTDEMKELLNTAKNFVYASEWVMSEKGITVKIKKYYQIGHKKYLMMASFKDIPLTLYCENLPQNPIINVN